MRYVTWVIWGTVGLLVGLAVASVGLFIATSGEHEVPATVVGDTELPAAEIDGVKLHLETFGAEDAPVIVVLHGGPGSDYRSLLGLEALSDDYRLVFYDQRGGGLSERVDNEKLTLDGYLAELDAVIDTSSPEAPVHLIGHSWGAMLATAYLGVAPDKVASAILMEPGFFDADEFADWSARGGAYMSGPGWIWQMIQSVFKSMHVEGPDDNAANDYLFGTMIAAFADHPDNPYHCPGEHYDAPHWRFGATASQLAAETPAAAFQRIADGAAAYPGPVLLLASACNDWIGEDLQARHAERFADARLEIIADSGHEMVWDNEPATLAAVRGFLDGL